MSTVPPESSESRTALSEAAQTLARVQEELAAERARADGLERAVLSNRQIGVAIGILVSQLHVDADTAFGLLAKASQKSQTKLREVAEHVVYTGTLEMLPIRNQRRHAPDSTSH